MEYNNILVHVPESAHRQPLLDTAFELSATFDAYITGLHVHVPSYHEYVAPGSYPHAPLAETVAQKDEEARQLDAALRTSFEQRASHAGIKRTEWRYQQGVLGDTHIASAIAAHAQTADLVIMGQYDLQDRACQVDYDTPALVAMNSAPPILIVPRTGRWRRVGRRIMLAWDGSREAAAVANAALPLLQRADAVTAVVVEEKKHRTAANGTRPCTEIVDCLARRGVEVSLTRQPGDRSSVSDILLATLADSRADLLCMGVYGHTRLRERIFGGTTYDMLHKSSVPTLIAC